MIKNSQIYIYIRVETYKMIGGIIWNLVEVQRYKNAFCSIVILTPT